MTSASSGKNGLVVADAGAIFSLAVLDQLELLNALFDDIAIPSAVWKEITLDKTVSFYWMMRSFFKKKVRSVKGLNTLTPLMDYGESECVKLSNEDWSMARFPEREADIKALAHSYLRLQL